MAGCLPFRRMDGEAVQYGHTIGAVAVIVERWFESRSDKRILDEFVALAGFPVIDSYGACIPTAPTKIE